MMKMINKQRVQRIKNLIYAFIILLMLLPLILMSILSFQMFGAIKDLNAKVDDLGKAAAFQAASQAPAESSEPDSGYVLEPDPQTSKPAEEEEPALEPENKLGAGDPLKNSEGLAASPDDGAFGVGVQGEASPPSADGGNELGGGAPIDADDEDYLGAASADASGTGSQDAGSSNKEADKVLATNPQMGSGDDEPSPDYTLNPSTGS